MFALEILKKINAACAVVALGCILVGCAASTPNYNVSDSAETSQPSSVPAGQQPASVNPNGHELGPGDIFEVKVFGEPDLSGVRRVDSNGTSSFPLIGRNAVKGKDGSALATLLEKKYAEFIKNPRVSVVIKEANSQKIYIFGQVKQPGTFAYESGMNIIHAITLAGGFEVVADQNGTYINRIVNGQEKRLQISVKSIGQGKASNVSLLPGDIIYVPESMF